MSDHERNVDEPAFADLPRSGMRLFFMDFFMDRPSEATLTSYIAVIDAACMDICKAPEATHIMLNRKWHMSTDTPDELYHLAMRLSENMTPTNGGKWKYFGIHIYLTAPPPDGDHKSYTAWWDTEGKCSSTEKRAATNAVKIS